VRALGESEARLARAQATAMIGSWELDLLTGEMWWSDELYRLLGLRPGAFTPDRQRLLAAVHPDDRERLDDWLGQGMSATAESFTYSRVLSGPDGELRARWHSEVSRNRAGDPIQVLGTVQNVTEVVRVRLELDEARKLEAVGTLAAGIAHDFNNLLTVIGGNVTLALESGADGALLQPAKRATDRAIELVGKLLDFARSGTINESPDSERVIVDMRQPT
jgi:signal transduction histidine kinase